MALQDIQTIIVLMLENRSFDHVLGYLSLEDTPHKMPVDGLSDSQARRDRFVNSYEAQHYYSHPLLATEQRFEDPPHERATIAIQIGRPPFPGSSDFMGGFVESYMQAKPPPEDPGAVMGYYPAAAVPVWDFLARNFTVCDHWFAALPTGTQANRLMAMSGESSIIDNAPVFLPDQNLVYDWLSEHGVSWCAYQYGEFLPFFSLMPRWLPEIVTSLTLSQVGGRGRFRRYSKFREHWQGDDPMPSVIFLEPEYTDGPHANPNDDHPPSGIAKGQLLIAEIYNDLISNPARWQNTLFIVTYDEHGGFFDHVPPLSIPQKAGGYPFKTTGVRVPALLISPQVAAGQVFDRPLDHTSFLQLLADRFNPNQDYSAPVGARQTQLARLAEALSQLPATPRAPEIPQAVLDFLRGLVPQASPENTFGAPGAAANSQAMDNAAAKVAQDHPELLKMPAWHGLANFLKENQGPPSFGDVTSS